MPRVHLGDKGTTQVNKSPNRVGKDSNLIYFYGQIDLLNAHINLALNIARSVNILKLQLKPKPINLIQLLENLIRLNSSIVASFFCLKLKLENKKLQNIMQQASLLEDVFTVNNFIWVYNNELASYLNLCRTQARIVEHAYYKIKNNPLIKANINDEPIRKFLNRQSTIFFHLALGVEKIQELKAHQK